MLEHAGVLRTWACSELPSSAKPVAAERLPDHRLAYLDFEGPLTGDRGSVTRIDAGEYELLSESSGQAAAEIRIHLRGQILVGTLVIENLTAESDSSRLSFAGG
jgi:hypothetical protein